MTKPKPEAKQPSPEQVRRALERAYDAGWEDALEIIRYIRNIERNLPVRGDSPTEPPPPKPH